MKLATLGSRGVLDLQGRSRMLGGLWLRRPALVVWLRHFACLFCKEQASLLYAERGHVAEMGARLAFVGHGSPHQGRAFRDRFAPGAEIYIDPSRYTYRELGARESAIRTVGGLAFHGPRAMSRGYFQTGIQGGPFQMGGVLVAGPGDELVYLRVSGIAGDHPPVHEVLEALERAVRRTGERSPAPMRRATERGGSMASDWPRQLPGAARLSMP